MAARIYAPSCATFGWLTVPAAPRSIVLPVAGNYRDLRVPLAGLDLAACTYQVQPDTPPGVLQAAFAPERTLDPLPIPPPGGMLSISPPACDALGQLIGVESLGALGSVPVVGLGQIGQAPRDGVVALCQEYVGGSVGDSKFDEVTQYRASAPRYSSCGDLVNFVLYRMGCRDPSIVNRDEPQDGLVWHVGENLSRPISGARNVGAWVDYSSGLLPKPGDCALIGEWPDEIEHMFVVLDAGPDTWITADYGAVNSAGQQSSSTGVATLSDGRLGRRQRKLIGWIDIDLVPRTAPAMLPGTGTGAAVGGGGGGGSLPIVLGAAALVAAGIYWGSRR